MRGKKRTEKLVARLQEILAEWPAKGDDCDQRMDVQDACEAWERDA